MQKYENVLKEEAKKLSSLKPVRTEGSVGWEAPSNIAIVKYWGKFPGQIPANASLSMTLEEAVTKTRIGYSWLKDADGVQLDFAFEGKKAPDFEKRIKRYLDSIAAYFPWLSQIKLTISSENTFPHSSGIASSASAMGALSLGLCELEEQLYGQAVAENFFRKASFMGRLGSGSAARSLYGKFSVWGYTASCKDSSDEYAIPVENMHENFLGMRDSILIIESGKKQVSSSMGHDLMKTNPYAKLRFDAAEENMQRLCSIVREGDLRQFIDVMENEALTLHAMMMTSRPGFLLMQANSVEAIHRIREYRKESGMTLGFTLDAGANVHLLYPKNEAGQIGKFIDDELKGLCENELVLHDRMGDGPVKLV
jgi:diphosphomevalonate decarboxylase